MNRIFSRRKQRVSQLQLGPWPGVAAARSFLAFLADEQSDTEAPVADHVREVQLANWLVEQGIAPLAHYRCQDAYPSLSRRLQEARYSSVATNSIHKHNLEQISAAFSLADIPFVLLKGAALAETTSAGWERRTMSDVDIWLKESDIRLASQIMHEMGFVSMEKETRPIELEIMSAGELPYYRPGMRVGVVELHLSPFPGWWLKRTAVVDNEAIWSRIKPINQNNLVFQLSAEDTIIHLAVHLAVNHQCSLMPIRSLLDIAFVTLNSPLSWEIVVSRAKQMHVKTAVWLVLYLLQQLIGTVGLEKPLRQLQPTSWRQHYLRQFVSPESILLGANLSSGRIRFLYLLLLVDQLGDRSRLVYRTLWPEGEWLAARYGEPTSHWKHLAHIIRYGQI